MILIVTSCNSRKTSSPKDKSYSQEITAEQTDNMTKKRVDEIDNAERITSQLIKKYPNALISDSIQETYTIFIQQSLENSDHQILIKEADIKDIMMDGENFKIILYSNFPEMVASLIIKPEIWKDFKNKLEIQNNYLSCCYVAEIESLIPIPVDIKTKIDRFSLTPDEGSITEDDVSQYIHIDFDRNFRTFYFIKGILLDISILE